LRLKAEKLGRLDLMRASPRGKEDERSLHLAQYAV